jgi:3-vinyl bacteriochlorophyllide hydratase
MKRRASTRVPLYSVTERQRRDASRWTRVQAVLAPLQFLVFAASLCLVVRYLYDAQGLAAATVSVLVKTALLYAIMISGSLWEHDVFGKYLFAKVFFWEDVVSMLVIALHTAYVAALWSGWLPARELMLLALAAYASYLINAAQFLLKFRAARLPVAPSAGALAVSAAGAGAVK